MYSVSLAPRASARGACSFFSALLIMPALVLVAPSVAGANGLVLTLDGEAATTTLVPLEGMEITSSLSDTATSVEVVRSYAIYRSGAEGVAGARVTFYASLMGGESIEVEIKGSPVGGVILEGDEADDARVELVGTLSEPGALRELGSGLFVSEAIALDGEDVLEVRYTLRGSPHSHDTLQSITLPMDWHMAPIPALSITTSVEADDQVRAIYSPFHEMQLTRESPNHLTGTYQGYDVPTSLAAQVLFAVGNEDYRLDLLPFRYSDAEGGYVMALLSPPLTPPEEDVVSRDLVFVVDTSGSMEGEKMNQAKAALDEVLGQLRPEDSFNVVSFDTLIATSFPAALEANDGAISDARSFVEGLSADGGTDIYGALAAGFDSLPSRRGTPRYIVLITDGVPTEGETDIEAILQMVVRRNEVGARVFSLGIGNDVNTVLLDRLARETQGESIYIRPGQSVEEAVTRFFGQIQAPVLSSPALELGAIGVKDLYPATLPDLFAGQTVTLVGRYAASDAADVQLIGGGEVLAARYGASLPDYAVRNGFVPKIWARRHIGALLHEVKLGNTDPAIVEEATTLAERYGIVTDFTVYTTSEEGDTSITYSEVPQDSVGDLAVSTSAGLDEVEQGDTVLSASSTRIRLFSDRALPLVEAWHTDSSLEADPSYVDLHFGSQAYFELAREEAAHRAGGLLSLSPNLRFELHGRAFRVTEAAEGVEMPTESLTIPRPTGLSAEGVAEVINLDTEGGIFRPVSSEPKRDEGCSTALGGTHAPWRSPLGFILVVAGLAAVVRARR